MGDWNRWALRTLRISSPLPLIAGLAALLQGLLTAGVLLLLMSAVMFGFGKPRDSEQPPREHE